MSKIFILILFFPLFLSAQNDLKNIKNPGDKRVKKCAKYYQIYRKLPDEVRYNIKVINGQILFYFPSEELFKKIFDKKYDGIAIDIISKDQFNCVKGNQLANSWAYKGELLPPLFKKELEERMVIDKNNNVLINYGFLPQNYDPLNVECNMLLLQKKFNCGYHNFSNIDYSQWDLLEMGLYRDSIPKEIELNQLKIFKELTFHIPFEKNQNKFDTTDLQPLFDSLQFTDFKIRSIEIHAYSSIEGTRTNNKKLQNARAYSIIDALQSYQKSEIPFHITTSENWKAFYNDIKDTRFRHLEEYSKLEIKEKLEKLQDSEDINSILNSHRKAIIKIQLEREVSVEKNSDELVSIFGQSINSQNINQALYVQNFIFEQIKANKLPEDFLNKLEVPYIALYSPLINNETIFEYENSKGLISDHIKTFEELLTILPNNPKIQYNIAALKLRASTTITFPQNRKQIWSIIKNLNRKIDKSLITRLSINYHLLNTEYLDNQKAFRQKNKSLRQVYSNYKNLELTDWERLLLARFLSIYSQFKWAESVLTHRAYKEDALPELVDYYFRLTIDDNKKLNRPEYISLINRVVKTNKETFCNLFLPTEQGGFTFQLLLNQLLADIYCENCIQNGNDM